MRVRRSVRVPVNPDILVWARETAGYEPEEAAKKINNVKPERLLAWEAGELAPTIGQLRTMARAYKRPLSVFFLPRRPTDFMAMRDLRRQPGGIIRRYSPELLYEMRSARERRELALELFEELEEPPPAFALQASLRDKPEEVGQRVRRALDVSYADQITWREPREGYRAWRSRIERANVLVFQMTRVASEEVSGFALAEDALPIIAVNRKDVPARRTFSLLHEFVHLMLRASGASDLDVESARPPEAQEIEVFCNHVAAAALMPRERFLAEPIVIAQGKRPVEWPDEDIQELSRRYCVSREAVLRRLLTFGRATNEFYQEKRAQFLAEQRDRRARELARLREGVTQYRRNPPQEALSSYGHSFVRLVLDTYYQNRITLSDVVGYLGVRVKHLPAVEQAIGTG